MTRHFFLSLFLACTFFSFGQKLYFSKANYSDSAALANNIPLLATTIIKTYKDDLKEDYYDNIFRLHMVAKNYGPAVKYLDTTNLLNEPDTAVRRSMGYWYRTYCQTMNEPAAQKNFNTVYAKHFLSRYESFTRDAASWVDGFYFNNTVSEMEEAFDKFLDKFKKRESDSIALEDAIKLCRKYGGLCVYEKTNAVAKRLIVDVENKKYISNDSVLIKMTDGGSIALSIVRPRAVTKPLPVVLMYSIYPGGDHMTAKEAAEHGFIGIVANTRGKRLSPDNIEPFENDARDAYEIIDWISKQSWCNGKIGMYGGSYLGFSQWSAAKKLHPALKTIVPQVSVGVGIDFPVHNGIFMGYSLRWLHYVYNNKLTDYSEFSDVKRWVGVADQWYKSGRSFRALDSIDKRPSYLFQRWLDHPTYDSFWKNMTPQAEEFSKINIPVFTITGYYDDDQLGAMHYYKEHHKWNNNPNHYLLIGPYDHYGPQGYPSREISGYRIDSVANIPVQQIVFDWFNHTLKGGKKPEILKNKVNFEIMGANQWKHVSSLNKMCNDTLTFYLSNVRSEDHYKLLANKPSTIEYINEEIDLTLRKDHNESGIPVRDADPIIDTVLLPSERKLVYVSSAFEKPFAISGSVSASIVASINKKDMDLAIDLYELMPDGKYFKLQSEVQRASLAKDKTKRQLLQPGQIETIPVSNTAIVSKQLQKGSRLVVVVGMQNNSYWQVNYGSGKDVSDETMLDAKEPFQIKWYNNSMVKIPVIR